WGRAPGRSRRRSSPPRATCTVRRAPPTSSREGRAACLDGSPESRVEPRTRNLREHLRLAPVTGPPTTAVDGKASRDRCRGTWRTAMRPGSMNPAPLLPLALLGAAPPGPVQEVPKQYPVGKYMTPLVAPEPRPIGPTGTLGADVYRKRRKALMDKMKTGATLIVNEAKFDGLREGMDFYYLTGIDEPGAA